MGNESNGSNVPVDINAQAKKACGWFAAIAAFSVINSLLIFFKSQVTFVIGLGITTIIDGFMSGMREEVSGNASIIITAIGIVINLLIIGIYVLIWLLSRNGSRAAYIIGMVLYALDAAIFVVFKDWLGIAFHAFFLYSLFVGYRYIKARAMASAIPAIASEPTAKPPFVDLE
ncbi:MAG: hypothetical protein A2Y12_07570 [Planctomycetes bacterium GWF2_42_9]|nr:MAG: hypothetical protein A2Y12_07570 [Planctomycetes bacterium GWF2_42_9]HAL45705.1 hypothetical protein [Phycisphaerales bacterium]